jgi:hypothetical protein
VALVSLAFRPELFVSPSYAWIGDTVTLYAAAGTDPTSWFCSRVLYTAAMEQQRFQFSSTDTNVAVINGRALFTARTPGVTRLVAASAGLSDTLWTIVGPAFASLRVTVTPATAHVGDSLTVEVDALDPSGAVVLGAEIQRPQLLPPSDKLATWLPSDRPYRGFSFIHVSCSDRRPPARAAIGRTRHFGRRPPRCGATLALRSRQRVLDRPRALEGGRHGVGAAGRYRVMSILIEYPLLALLPSLVFAGLFRVTRRPFVFVVALAWILYGIYEYAMHQRILCSGECNIRVDLLLIYPVLAVTSVVGLAIAGASLRARPRDPRP